MSSLVRRAVLLAAGRGQRLTPHTDRVPKPMLPLAGRPLIEYILLHLGQAGIVEALVVVGHLGEQIEACFGDGRDLGLDLCYQEQIALEGTGAAALLAASFVGDEPFFLGWGDVIAARGDYQRLVHTYRREEPDALLLLERVDDPTAGAAVYVEGRRITAMVEKPPPGTSTTRWNQAGLSVFSPEIFSCLRRLSPSSRGEIELTEAVQLLIEQGRTVCGLPMEAPRLHLTRPADIPAVEGVLRRDPRYGATPGEVA